MDNGHRVVCWLVLPNTPTASDFSRKNKKWEKKIGQLKSLNFWIWPKNIFREKKFRRKSSISENENGIEGAFSLAEIKIKAEVLHWK